MGSIVLSLPVQLVFPDKSFKNVCCSSAIHQKYYSIWFLGLKHDGATTLSITTLSIMMFIIAAFSINAFRFLTFSITTFSGVGVGLVTKHLTKTRHEINDEGTLSATV